MAAGITLIFDKSALQCLNLDEAVWLDTFFTINITPLFFIETLADLEKQVRAGRTAEQVVGNLAEKTPDLNSHANIPHGLLIQGELMGGTVEMEGRPLVSGGQVMQLEGQTGIMFQLPPEQEALSRWQRHEFLALERLMAKAWRHALSGIDFNGIYYTYQDWFRARPKPRTLDEAKALAAEILDRYGPDKENAFRFGLDLLGVHPEAQVSVLSRWQTLDCPPLRLFAPYCRHVAEVDLFFYLAIAAGLIGRDRPSHKVDLAYLYYLPFCKVFTSKDNLHRRITPLFLRPDQDFVWAEDFKADLRCLDEHYSALPEEIKAKGLFAFASHPPVDASYLVSRLWDKHLPGWRNHDSGTSAPIDEETEKYVLERLRHFTEDARPISPPASFDSDEVENMVLERKISLWKGKWRRLPPGIEESEDSK